MVVWKVVWTVAGAAVPMHGVWEGSEGRACHAQLVLAAPVGWCVAQFVA